MKLIFLMLNSSLPLFASTTLFATIFHTQTLSPLLLPENAKHFSPSLYSKTTPLYLQFASLTSAVRSIFASISSAQSTLGEDTKTPPPNSTGCHEGGPKRKKKVPYNFRTVKEQITNESK